jgi:hypothetical protein
MIEAGDASVAANFLIVWANPTAQAYNKVFEGYHLTHEDVQTIENIATIFTYKGTGTESTLKEIVVAPEAFNEYVEYMGLGIPLYMLNMCK